MIIRVLRHIFPKVHRHPAKPLHEWKGWELYDDATRPLEDWEHGVVAVNGLKWFWDYEMHGRLRRKRMVIS
jgi:hypothetical protein